MSVENSVPVRIQPFHQKSRTSRREVYLSPLYISSFIYMYVDMYIHIHVNIDMNHISLYVYDYKYILVTVWNWLARLWRLAKQA